MKKIILAALTVLMMFGLVGCSGVLHDTPVPKNEPVKIDDASWYYYDITIWGDNTDKAQIIINDGDKLQSGDTKLPAYKASEGAVFYYTMDKANKELKVSYQKDEPEYTAKPGVVRIYVYTNITTPTAYYWDGAFAGPTWPGKAINKVGAVVREEYEATMQIASITVTGLPTEYQSLELYARGAFFAANWDAVAANKGTIVGDTLTITYSTPVSVTKTAPVGDIPAEEFKIATSDWKKQITNSTTGGGVLLSILNGKKVAIIGVVNSAKSDNGEEIGCDWSIQVLGDIE